MKISPLFRSFAFLLCLSGSVFTFSTSFGQDTGRLKITYSGPDINLSQPAENGKITCAVTSGTFSKRPKDVKLYFYTRNDVRDIPMELIRKGKPLCPKRIKPRRNNNDNIVFMVMTDDIFFTDSSPKGYSWKWKGRARAPISPVVAVNGEKVNRLDCWFVLKANNKIYTSDTTSIIVQ